MDAATIKEMINSIIEFLKALIAGVEEALAGVVKTPGYDKAENYPENFPMAE